MKSSGKVHTCATCGKRDVWGKEWSWYGSLRDEDDCNFEYIAKTTVCSDHCRDHLPAENRRWAPEEITPKVLKARAKAAAEATMKPRAPIGGRWMFGPAR